MSNTINTAIRRVYISALSDYDEERVENALIPLLDGMLCDNGIEKSSLFGKNILIKPNLLAKREPESGITTHPMFVKICARYFTGLGARVIIADSPGGIYTRSSLDAIYKATKMTEAVEENGAELNFDTSFQAIYKKELSDYSFNIITPIANADLVVNLCRLKTHALCEISASVKNMFGAIPGLQKPEQHARFPKRESFANMLCDLCLITAPCISIIDGVCGMEGNGPAGGTLRKVGAVIAGANPFANDLVASYIMGYNANEVGTVNISVKRGYCPENIDGLEIVGENPARFAQKFKRPDASAGGLVKQIPSILGGRVQKLLEPRPYVYKRKCIGCGICAKNCPVSTITVKNKKAKINPESCIKCYCCQEFCPEKAIKVKRFFG